MTGIEHSDIGDRIKWRRQQLQMTQTQLATATGVTQPSVSEWEKKTASPEVGRLKRLADTLQTTVEWLVLGGTTELPVRMDFQLATRMVPLISWTAAVELASYSGVYHPGETDDWIPVATDSTHLIGLEIASHSMDREFPKGTVIIVDYVDKTLVDGRYYVIKLGEDAKLRRWCSHPPTLETASSDPEHASEPAPDEVSVIGRVIYSMKKR